MKPPISWTLKSQRERDIFAAGYNSGKFDAQMAALRAVPQAPQPQTEPPQVEVDENGDGWTPEFTVWVVRRGSRFPMVVDSIFHDEHRANLRATLLGNGEGWHVERYQHVRAAAPVSPAPPKE